MTNPTLLVKEHTAPIEETMVVPGEFAETSADDSGWSPLPEQLIERYVAAAVLRSVTEQLQDGTWYADVPLLQGVWAEGKSETELFENLKEVIKGWLILKIEDKDRDIPKIESIDLNVL